ncbi:MAG: hypothetical protein R3F43_22545 [bacterium]
MNPSRAAGLLVGLIAPAVSSTPLAAPAPSPASGQTSIGLEIGLEAAEVCYTEPPACFPSATPTHPGRPGGSGRRDTTARRQRVRHQTAGGFVVGGQVAAILGRASVMGAPTPPRARPSKPDDGAYTLFGGALRGPSHRDDRGRAGLGALGLPALSWRWSRLIRGSGATCRWPTARRCGGSRPASARSTLVEP